MTSYPHFYDDTVRHTRPQATSSLNPNLTYEAIDQNTFVEWVELDKMVYPHEYGRPISERRVKKMIQEGDCVKKFGTITLSMRSNGQFAVLDGNHRVTVARRLGTVRRMLAKVFIDLTVEEEAALFDAFHDVNRPSALDRFRARLTANEPAALDINRIVERHGLHIDLKNSVVTGGILAVSALDQIYENQGPQALDEVVEILKEAWGKERRAWITITIMGMGAFWLRYKDTASTRRLIDRLRMVAPEALLAQANVGLSYEQRPAARMGRAIYNQYQRGLRSDSKHYLPEWKERPGTSLVSQRKKTTDNGEE